MGNTLHIIIAVAIAVLLSGGCYLTHRFGISFKIPRICLTVALIFASLYRYLVEREAIYFIQGLNVDKRGLHAFNLNIPLTILGSLLVWFTFAALLAVVMDQFFEFKTLRNLTRFFSAPVLLIDLVLFKTLATAVVGRDVFVLFDIRTVLLAIEIGIGLGLIFARIITDGFTLPKGRELGSMLYALPFAVISIMPCYIPQLFIGFKYTGETVKVLDISEAHRIVLYFSIIIPFLIFHALKNKSMEVKRFAIFYLAMALLWSYLRYWNLEELSDPTRWPLHLCNTAMFLIPLCVIFKMNRLFYFCLFINVLGAVLAMVMPNYSESNNALSFKVVHFWLNHYAAFFMPILIIALKLFERPKFKQWVYSLTAFTVYFLLMLFINAWFSNYDPGVDFFFLNSDFIADKLGKWAEDTRKIITTFNIKELTFTFYPLYQFLFYLVYVAVSVGVWFLYEILFTSWDAAEDRRLRERDYKRMKKELNEFLGGRSIHQPICGDSSPHLVLKHFRKKYGRNKHYSVDDVSFEVRGGEIFGFLGPNGAGKSTIIKSVVGIQTITEGHIEICGFDVDKQSVQAKKELGFVPDHYALYENLTGREYINYIADLYEVKYDYRNKTIEKYVELFQLTGSFDNPMKTYSHGMKQKITIMAALVHNPKVWILDEPLTGLDPTSIHEVKECMKEHAAAGNIVFFSSHIIDVVEKICDKIAIIKKGKLRAVAKVSELEARGIDLERFYLDIIYGDDSDTSVKLIGVTEEESGIVPKESAFPEAIGKAAAEA